MNTDFINDLVKPADFGIDHLLEPEEIDQLTVAEYRAYERKLKAYRDWKNTIVTAYVNSYEEAYKKAYEKAYEKAFKESQEEKAIEVAREMKTGGEPIEKIMKYTQLTEEEINAL